MIFQEIAAFFFLTITYRDFWHFAQKYTRIGKKNKKVLINQLRCNWK